MNSYNIIAQGLPQPQLDVATRWNSTYNMLQKLKIFKNFCGEHLDTSLKLSSPEWEKIDELVAILNPVFIATQKLQTEQLFLGDFYKLWLELKLSVDAMKTTKSKLLFICLEKREENLLNNATIISAVYLDPRIRRILLQNPIKIMTAKTHLKRIFQKIYDLTQVVNILLWIL